MDTGINIREWTKSDRNNVLDLILSIQRNEFGVNITAKDQPDLSDADLFYQTGKGNFWLAELDGQTVGTIALKQFDDQSLALRKMFVHQAYRGKEKGTAQQLLDKAVTWSRQQKIQRIYLGTTDSFKAAHRFYEKNGFDLISEEELPDGFPKMLVDTRFYYLKLV
jgi:N-acetylglutamate synthase-like GNAT family acetyltransferase